MREKVIGLCIANLREEDSMKNLELIHQYAYENNYGVLTFFPCMELDESANEYSIENLYMINYDAIDALIIDAFKITNATIVRKLVAAANAHGVLTVVINAASDEAVSVVSTVENAFEKIVRHIITDHGCKKIDFVAGYKNKWNTSMLMDIYKTALFDNGIEYDESRVAYGEYSGKVAEDAIAGLLDKDIPDALVCANDLMAFIACRMLEDRGLKVPEDVIVTGIDGSILSEYRKPILTTCRKNMAGICKKAIGLIKDKFEGKNLSFLYTVDAEAIFAESCGCEKDMTVDYRERFDYVFQQKELSFKAQAGLLTLAEKLMDASQINEIATVLHEGLPKDSFLCVKDSFMQDIFQEDSIAKNPMGNDKFYIIADNRDNQHTWESFILNEMFPEKDKMLETNCPIVITPIHYQNIQYGYLVLHSCNYRVEASILERFVMNFNATIGRYVGDRKLKFVNSELFYVNESIKQMKERDLLTGMFNSRGFLRELENLKNACIRNNEKIVLVCVDLEGLGKLNDIYGHSEGDVAIQTLAKILQDCVSSEDISTHLGSDEFVLALHTKDEPESVMSTFFTALDGRVENYNAVSGKEYSLEINETYLSVKPTSELDMKAVLDEALGRKRMLKQNKRSMSLKDSSTAIDKNIEEEYKLAKEVLDDNKFNYAFQPIVNAKNGEIVAYEALMRTDTRKFISPLTLINYATKNNRLYEVEYATFFNVFEKATHHIESLEGRKIFINSIPGFQLNDNDYAKLKRKFKKVFEHVVVEITEQTEMDDDALVTIRTRSESERFEVAIDDYGTGYSNTTSLLRYLPNYIKIDRLLITGIQEDPKKQHFVKSIIEFAHDNGFLALAEGVETEEELAAVIHMEVDLIQGFFTAKPSFDFIDNIPEEIKDKIVGCTQNVKDNPRRKVYVADAEDEIFLVRLALENYTSLVVSQPEVTIVGNAEFPADIQIKVKDSSESIIHLKNVNLSSIEDMPCIDIGANCNVTLVVENVNHLNGMGIRVPESSSVRIVGDDKSELHIDVDGEKTYAIGNNWDSGVGSIELSFDGLIDITAKGHYTVGIGGGAYRTGRGIRIVKGKIVIDIASANSVGIGSVVGRIPVVVSECSLYQEMKTFSGVAVGTWNGEQDVSISNALVDIKASGNTVCAIGSIEGCNGSIRITSAHVLAVCKASNVMLIGNQALGVDVSVSKARLDLVGEGNTAVGIGSYDGSGIVSIIDALVNMDIKAAIPVEFGASEESCRFIEAVRNIKINE